MVSQVLWRIIYVRTHMMPVVKVLLAENPQHSLKWRIQVKNGDNRKEHIFAVLRRFAPFLKPFRRFHRRCVVHIFTNFHFFHLFGSFLLWLHYRLVFVVSDLSLIIISLRDARYLANSLCTNLGLLIFNLLPSSARPIFITHQSSKAQF